METNQWMALIPFRWMIPWPWFWWDVKMPFSGNVDVAPVTEWDLAGDVMIEKEVFRTIASPGKQLGRLSEAVIAVIDDLERQEISQLDPETLKRVDELRKITNEVVRAKQSHEDRIEGQIKDLLVRLEKTSPERYKTFLSELTAG